MLETLKMVHTLKKYVFSPDCVPGMALGSGETVMDQVPDLIKLLLQSGFSFTVRGLLEVPGAESHA